ncbi:MAG: site-2 protease family protein [Clostridia bacterium]|nr:site-2 protease family protein [Clostridia bacterium]
MKLRLFGTEVYISFLFAALIAFMLATDRTGLIIPTIFACAVHEGGHLFAMWICECQPKSIRLIPASVQIVRGFSAKPQGEITIALLGPAANIAVFLCLLLNYFLFQSENVLIFALTNLIIAVFNLLPVTGLDGGTVLKNLIARKTDIYTAERKVSIITLVLSAAMFFAGVYILISGKFNISVFIMAIYLLISGLVRR